MQELDCIEIFEAGEVKMKIYHYVNEDLDPVAYLQVGGFAELQLRVQDFEDLVEIIDLYKHGVDGSTEEEQWEETS